MRLLMLLLCISVLFSFVQACRPGAGARSVDTTEPKTPMLALGDARSALIGLLQGDEVDKMLSGWGDAERELKRLKSPAAVARLKVGTPNDTGAGTVSLDIWWIDLCNHTFVGTLDWSPYYVFDIRGHFVHAPGQGWTAKVDTYSHADLPPGPEGKKK